MNKRNYQKELEQLIQNLAGRTARLLLHSCCAPCSSYVLEYLSQFFEITVFFYNPNIYPPQEYDKRVAEQYRLIGQMKFTRPVSLAAANHRPEEFYQCVKGLEHLPEGEKRCYACYELRLREAAKMAATEHFDYFSTTLSISPLKHVIWLNEIGERLADEYQVAHLPGDFKKKDGYRRSVELSAQYGLYRQNYCGCVYSCQRCEP